MSGQIERLRHMSRNVGIFWVCILYAGLALSTAATFISHPELLRDWRGAVILALTMAFGLWYWFGYGLLDVRLMGQGMMSRDNDEYWRVRIDGTQQGVHWPSVGYWAVLLAINLVLVSCDTDYKWVLFGVYGTSMFVMALPRSLLITVPMAALIFVVMGWVPTNADPQAWLNFAVGAFVFVVYSATAYVPVLLIRGRFARERMYEQLERSHRELEEAHRGLAEAAERDRELAVLRERARLGRDMHDTLGHSLALIAVKLEAAQRLRAVDTERADHEIAATQAIARDALAELRAAIANLRGPLVASVPLDAALAREARDAAARASWQLTCDFATQIGLVDERTYEALLRVAGEALANAERHARATAVRVSLSREDDALVLRVHDDGVGILTTNPPRPTDAVAATVVAADDRHAQTRLAAARPVTTAESVITSQSGHYGITGMRERIAALGGRFAIGPDGEGQGTLVEARVPVTSR